MRFYENPCERYQSLRVPYKAFYRDYWGVRPEIFFDLPSVQSLIIDLSIRRGTIFVQI